MSEVEMLERRWQPPSSNSASCRQPRTTAWNDTDRGGACETSRGKRQLAARPRKKPAWVPQAPLPKA